MFCRLKTYFQNNIQNTKKTVILSSHILSEVEATCDRILIINKGQIVADGSSETLRQQAQGQEQERVNTTVNLRYVQTDA